MSNMDPGKNLKAMREALHLTQEKLGKLAGISKGQISHLETGEKRAGPKLRPRLAGVFKMTENEFMRALHSDEKEAVFLVHLHQISEPLRSQIVGQLAILFSQVKDNPEFLSGFIKQLSIYIDLAKKI